MTDHNSIFTGSIPEHYDHYLGPMFFEPYAIEVAKRIDPSKVDVALEIGCGTGRVTRHLRKVLAKHTKLIASDISPDMMLLAKEHLKDQHIEWAIINAQQLPFDDGSIDLVVCCFAYMFLEDKAQAFAEAYRVLKPGGMLIFTTWDKLEYNEASNVFRHIAKPYLPDPVPPSFRLPFIFNDHYVIKEMLETVGFFTIKIESVEKKSICHSAHEAAIGLARGGSLYHEIMKSNPQWIEEICEKLETELAHQFGDSPMVASMRAVVCETIK
ncbi:MAG: methyltransferase domain-containing protein [Saprospiraceae bacterium]|uniref:Methyltransferase domain-containing protein n=1 Tax=Candidatus Opimibacter skivensis TaxID=2982028 RepID=A0A9D7SS26_9BACT|nr:methyltransferase domain-containing protein [Candidatus Opimibacter skivensis]